MQQYGNNSFDAYDASAHVKQQQQHKQLQLPKQNPRWGQNREKPPITPPAQKRGTTPPPLRSSGVFNEGYEVDNQISTVSQQYTQYTTPQRQVVQTRQTYQYTPATASPGYTPATASPTGGINTSSVSTEVWTTHHGPTFPNLVQKFQREHFYNKYVFIFKGRSKHEIAYNYTVFYRQE